MRRRLALLALMGGAVLAGMVGGAYLRPFYDAYGFSTVAVREAAFTPARVIRDRLLPDLDGTTRHNVDAARDMLRERFDSDAPLQGKDPAEVAKLLNYVVFNHCAPDLPHTGQTDMNELFTTCRTSCGGYSYVLRGLLAAHGIRSRRANLHNLPDQGNHTAVEAEIGPDEWGFFDPSFGTYFSADGSIGGRPLSLEQIRFELTEKSAAAHAITAVRSDERALPTSLRDAYESDAFDFSNMSLRNYFLAEAAGSVEGTKILPLVLPLELTSGSATAGTLDFVTAAEGMNGFADWTNVVLATEKLSDDASYNFHVVGNYRPYFDSLNIIRLSGLTIGKTYRMTVAGFAPDDRAVQLVDIGRDLLPDTTQPEAVAAGVFTLERRFRARNDRGSVVIALPGAESARIHVYGVRVAEIR